MRKHLVGEPAFESEGVPMSLENRLRCGGSSKHTCRTCGLVWLRCVEQGATAYVLTSYLRGIGSLSISNTSSSTSRHRMPGVDGEIRMVSVIHADR